MLHGVGYLRMRLPNLGRLSWVAALVLLQSLLTFFAIRSDRFGDDPLILLIVPLVLVAARFGLRGAAWSGLLTSVLLAAWWLSGGMPGGIVWLILRMATYLAVALVVGAALDSRALLLRRLEHHSVLSLDLIATASFDGYFTSVNPAFTETLGFSREELLERPLLWFVHPDDREPTIAAIEEQTQEGRAVFRFENRYRTKDGSYRWLEWTSRPDAQAKELVAVARDVTERKRLEALAQAHMEHLEQAVDLRTQELRARNSDLEAARLETLRRLALAAEYRDDETHHHTERVGRMASLLAERLGLPEEMVELLRLAAPLHDVGKLAISDTVLLKPGRLTTEEFARMQEHVWAGAKLLSGSSSPVLELGEEIALTHHERWDGTGYPRRLRGEQIPISGRIVAIADVFDALTHHRPYKAAWPVANAVAEINRLSGRQFDPSVVVAFNSLDHQRLLDASADTSLATVA